MLMQNFGVQTKCIMGDVQMANGFFNRPLVARTQLLVDRRGQKEDFSMSC